jgi:uncharacterized protein (DUF58 family)
VVVISDFLSINWEQELGDLSSQHDVIALRITDPSDQEIPPAGLVYLRDTETGLRLHAPTGFPSFKRAWTEWHGERTQAWQAICRRFGVSQLELSTTEDAASALARFFRGRKR